jgi:hypothetical protein
MSEEQHLRTGGPSGPTASRRTVMQLAGGAALTAAAAGPLGLIGAAAAPVAPPGEMPGVGTGPDETAFRLVANSAQLLIRDGTPNWWLSPDIWVVPGTDPTGPPGSPVSGETAYVWSRVQNTGKDDAFGVEVRFYWANPSVQMLYSGINLIGTAVADIPAGETQDVLCLVPWNVVTVNDGHECLVVLARTPDAAPLPDVVDPVGYPNVAQRNLTVITGLGAGDFHLAVTVSAAPRVEKKVSIGWQIDRKLPEETLASLGIKGRRPARKPAVEVGLSLTRDPKEGIGEPVLELVVPPGRSVPVYVTVRGTGALAPEEYQAVHVIERDDSGVLGGISFVAVADQGGK